MKGRDRIGPYRILRLIRRGGAGSVYLGIDDRLGRRVVAKIYALPEEPVRSRMVLREAQTIAALDSMRVVKIHDVIVGDTHLAMIMEYVAGCDLEELLAERDLSLASILIVANDVAAAIAVARQSGIVHGDIKPGNVLITREGRVKLTDFGLAAPQGDSATAQGSLSCISPEQLLGKPRDVRSDLFALGCLLYRLLTGRHPFQGRQGLNSEALLRGAAPPLPAVLADGTALPNGLGALVERLLAADPEQRPGNTHAVRHQLQAIAAELPRQLRSPLRDEAEPVFRDEAVDDLPLQIPPGLSRQGRSRMPAQDQKWALFATWHRWQRRHWIAATTTVLCALGALLWGLWPHDQRVFVPRPVVALEPPKAAFPENVDPDILFEVLREQILAVRPDALLHGEAAPFLPAALDPALPPPPETLRIALQCSQTLCVLGLERERAGSFRYRQAVMPAGAPEHRWQALTAEAVAELFAVNL